MNNTASVTNCFIAAHSQSATSAPVPQSLPAISATCDAHAVPPRFQWVGRAARR